MNAFDIGCIGYQIYFVASRVRCRRSSTVLRVNGIFGRLFNFQVVNRRKTLYFVYNTVCKKQEGATNCVFCVF